MQIISCLEIGTIGFYDPDLLYKHHFKMSVSPKMALQHAFIVLLDRIGPVQSPPENKYDGSKWFGAQQDCWGERVRFSKKEMARRLEVQFLRLKTKSEPR